MRRLLYLVAFLTLWSLSLGQTCDFQTCKDCTASQGCGWCAATQRCLPGNAMGPSGDEYCYVSWSFGSCQSCSANLDCRTCQIHDADCYWCATANNGKGSCIGYSTQIGCPISHVCPCGDWSTCDDCAQDTNCRWCDSGKGDGVCSSTASQCPNGTLATHSCPCESKLDCPACKVGTNCAWCDDTATCYTKGDTAACNFHQISNTTCSAYCAAAASSCFSCNKLRGCVWCGDSKTCTDRDTATCQKQPQCPRCTGHSYCNPCLDSVGCKWCDGPGENFCAESCPSGINALTCLSYCNALTAGGCASCNSHAGCAWCNDKKECVDQDKTGGCMIAMSCDGKSSSNQCGFDGGAFVGGMFLVIGLAILGGGGYAVYRYKVKGGSYNKL